MFCEESVIIGDYHNYELKIGDGKNSEKVIKIANEIANLKNFHGEYVIVDLEHKERDDSARVSFFQLCKCKNYSKLSRYYVEIRVEEGTSAKLYNKTAGKKEVLRLFEEICVERKFPDLNSWKMFFDFNGDKKLDDRDEEKISHYTEVAVSFLNGENTPEDNCLYVDAIKYLA